MPSWIGPLNGNWEDAANWSGGVPNAVGAVATFNFFGQTERQVVKIANNTTNTIGTLNINNATEGVYFGGSASVYNTPSVLAFDGTDPAINHNSSSLLEFGQAGFLTLSLLKDTTFNVASSGAILINARMSGAGHIIKTGSGTLRLSLNLDTRSGGLRIDGGRVIMESGHIGSGPITLANGSVLQFDIYSTIANTFGTAAASSAAGGSGTLLITAAEYVEFTGPVAFLGGGTMTFGDATFTGEARFFATTGITHSTGNHSFAINGGTVVLGSSYSAMNLLFYSGTGLTSIATGATLETRSFYTRISNLDLNGGRIETNFSYPGALNVEVFDRSGSANAQNGTIVGTGFADIFKVNVIGSAGVGNYNLSAATFLNWTAGVDLVEINGSNFGNSLVGSQVNDIIRGGGGVDTIQGGLGNDEIVLEATNGGSLIDGGAGTDRLTINIGSISLGSITGIEELQLLNGANLTMSLAQFTSSMPSNLLLMGTGSLTINKSATDPTLNLGGLNFAAGSNVTIAINGSAATDIIKGSTRGANTINSGDSNDQIRGGNLADTINGGLGNDKIYGAGGADILTGGAGADQFRYVFATDSGLGAAADRITDFAIAEDRLNFALIDANANLAGDQAFNFIATAAFSNTGVGQIRYQNSGSNLLVQIDTDGNGAADMEVILQGLAGQALSGSNFLL